MIEAQTITASDDVEYVVLTMCGVVIDVIRADDDRLQFDEPSAPSPSPASPRDNTASA